MDFGKYIYLLGLMFYKDIKNMARFLDGILANCL
jgi:hypothetical protein